MQLRESVWMVRGELGGQREIVWKLANASSSVEEISGPFLNPVLSANKTIFCLTTISTLFPIFCPYFSCYFDLSNNNKITCY